MKHRTKVITAIVILGLVFGLTMMVITKGKRAIGKPISIGGVRLTVIDVLPGNSQFETDTLWQKWARKILPGRYQRWLPDRASSSPGIPNVIAVYLQVDGTNRTQGQAPWSGYTIVSMVGEEIAGSPLDSFLVCQKPKEIHCLLVKAIPRRDPEFLLKLAGKSGETLGTFRIGRHGPTSFPTWESHAMPQSVTNDSVVLTLKKLSVTLRENSGYDHHDRHMRIQGYRLWPSPEFEIRSQDARWEDSVFISTTLTDATGNSGFPLPRSESAWRLRAVLQPRDPEFTWVWPVPLPEPKVFEFFINPADVKTNGPAK